MKALTAHDIERIKENIFYRAWPMINDWARFPWHRTNTQLHVAKPESSQALAIDVFGTIKCSPDRNAVMNAIAARFGLPPAEDWEIEPEWMDHDRLLKEPRRSQIDICASSRSSRALILFECKFTEAGGRCSQTIKVARGARRLRQCTGSYELQENPINGTMARCALSGKGIRYWNEIPLVISYDAVADYNPCPFAGEYFQWMRNLTTCAAIARHRGWAGAVGAVFADISGLYMREKLQSAEWREFQTRVRGVAFQSISYQELIGFGAEASGGDPAWSELHEWVSNRKFAAISKLFPLQAPMAPGCI